ncbi:MAG: hypothetical protein KAX49_12500 [Halanaerobiales bacterium]|nr:hypothetical protein [Halanaerobiales bacterium]
MLSKKKIFIGLFLLVIIILVWCFHNELKSFFGGLSISSKDLPASKIYEKENKTVSFPNSDFLTEVEKIVQETNSSEGFSVPNSIEELKNLRNPFQKLAKLTSQQKEKETSVEEFSISEIVETPVEVNPNNPNDETFEEDQVTYQDLYEAVKEEIVSEKFSSEENVQNVIIEPKIEYPTFLLKGIVLQGERRRAIIYTGEQSNIINEGNQFKEWLIEKIEKEYVMVVSEEGQRFSLTLEGVILDEEQE